MGHSYAASEVTYPSLHLCTRREDATAVTTMEEIIVTRQLARRSITFGRHILHHFISIVNCRAVHNTHALFYFFFENAINALNLSVCHRILHKRPFFGFNKMLSKIFVFCQPTKQYTTAPACVVFNVNYLLDWRFHGMNSTSTQFGHKNNTALIHLFPRYHKLFNARCPFAIC